MPAPWDSSECLYLNSRWLFCFDFIKNKQSRCYQSSQLLELRGCKKTDCFNVKNKSVVKFSLLTWICSLPLCWCFSMFIRLWTLEIIGWDHLPFLLRNRGSWDVRGKNWGLKLFRIWERLGGDSVKIDRTGTGLQYPGPHERTINRTLASAQKVWKHFYIFLFMVQDCKPVQYGPCDKCFLWYILMFIWWSLL